VLTTLGRCAAAEDLPRVDLECAGHVVRVRAATSILERLRRRWEPYVAFRQPSAGPALTVTALDVDVRAHRGWFGRGEQIVLHRGNKEQYHPWLIPLSPEEYEEPNRDGMERVEGTRVGVYSLQTDSVILYDEGGEEMTVLGTRALFRDTAEHVLTLLANLLERDQFVLVHGASLAGPRGAVLITGDKGKGKTTVLLSLVRRPGFSFMANDRTLLGPGVGGGVACRGWHEAVGIRIETLKRLPHYADRLPPEIREVVARAAPDEYGKKVRLLPENARALLGERRQPQVNSVAAVIFPDLSAHGGRTGLHRVAADEALAVLRAQLLSPFDPQHPRWLRLVRVNPALVEERARRVEAALARGCAFYTLTGDPDPEAITALVGDAVGGA
jgi:hypothetical protein